MTKTRATDEAYVDCDKCDIKVRPRGLAGHKRMAHGGIQESLVYNITEARWSFWIMLVLGVLLLPYIVKGVKVTYGAIHTGIAMIDRLSKWVDVFSDSVDVGKVIDSLEGGN